MNKSNKTKCTENPFLVDDSDEDLSVDSEGGITPLKSHTYTPLSKHKTYNGSEPLPLEFTSLKHRKADKCLKMEKLGVPGGAMSRNTFLTRSVYSHADNL